MAIFNHLGALTGDEALAAALTSDSPAARIMARGAAATWMPGFVAWANDELNRSNGNPADFLFALTLLQLQTFASIAGQIISPEGEEYVVKLYLELAAHELPKHMGRIREEMQE